MPSNVSRCLRTAPGLIAVALASCYSPELPDCVRACAAPDECAPDQVCGGDGLCASPDVAGRCDELAAPDARVPRPDARDDDPDATSAPDATTMAQLRVVIDGRGKIKAEMPIDEDCESFDELGTSCMFTVPLGTIVRCRETDGHGWVFDSWTHPACGGPASMGSTCTVTVGPGTTNVTATFIED